MDILYLYIFYVVLSRVHRKLTVFEEHHLGEWLLSVFLDYREEDTVDFELVAGLLAERTDPTRVGRLGCHHQVVCQVETLVMCAEEATRRVFQFLHGHGLSEWNLDNFADYVISF